MPTNNFSPATGFYFSLPRLIVSARGKIGARSSSNWIEANVVGSFMQVIAYAFAFHLLLTNLLGWTQLLLFLPLALVVWVFWLLLFYANSFVIRFLRAHGLMRRLSDERAQNFLVVSVITLFAIELLRSGSPLGLLGMIWLGAVALNLGAAILLTRHDREDSP